VFGHARLEEMVFRDAESSDTDGDLANGKSRLIKFKDSANCEQDLQVVFDEGDTEVVWEGLDLCEINKLTLKYNRAAKTVSAIKE